MIAQGRSAGTELMTVLTSRLHSLFVCAKPIDTSARCCSRSCPISGGTKRQPREDEYVVVRRCRQSFIHLLADDYSHHACAQGQIDDATAIFPRLEGSWSSLLTARLYISSRRSVAPAFCRPSTHVPGWTAIVEVTCEGRYPVNQLG